jgi:hypothetical protein
MSVFPTRAGEAATQIPAASIAAILDSASPFPRDDHSGVTHAAAGRGGTPGDETDHQLLASVGLVLDELRCVLFGGSAYLAIMTMDLVAGSARNSSSIAMKSVPLMGQRCLFSRYCRA